MLLFSNLQPRTDHKKIKVINAEVWILSNLCRISQVDQFVKIESSYFVGALENITKIHSSNSQTMESGTVWQP